MEGSTKFGYYIQPFDSNPGVSKDTTIYDSETFIDSQHTRFFAGRARKMGGYEKVISGNNHIVRALYSVAINDFTRVFIFRDTGVSHIDFLANGSITGEVDRTPVGWVPPAPGTPSLTFSVDSLTTVSTSGGSFSSAVAVFFVAPPNSQNPSQTQEAQVYYVDAASNQPFNPINVMCSGGLIVFAPYLMVYGNDGVIRYSSATDFTVFPAASNNVVSSTKILACKRYRGGSILAWTIDSLYTIARDTTNPSRFTSVTTSPKISLLSPSSIIEGHDNSFYWVGNEQFYVYNGVTQTLPNSLNRLQFFANLNKKYKGKVWGMYTGNFQELWWFSPENENTECNRLYGCSLAEKAWFDSNLPRSCGLERDYLDYPLLADTQPNIYSVSSTFSVWQHEKGFNIVDNGMSYPLTAYFQTRLFTAFDKNPQVNLEMILRKMEVDVNQMGDMQIQIITYNFPKSDPYESQIYTLTASQKQIDLNIQGRYVSFKFISNDMNGFFQMGKNQVNYQLGGARP
jgi:hypothetical protein